MLFHIVVAVETFPKTAKHCLANTVKMAGALQLLALLAFACALAPSAAQYLADDYVDASFSNNSLYFAGPGGYQEVLYEDATNPTGTPQTH